MSTSKATPSTISAAKRTSPITKNQVPDTVTWRVSSKQNSPNTRKMDVSSNTTIATTTPVATTTATNIS